MKLKWNGGSSNSPKGKTEGWKGRTCHVPLRLSPLTQRPHSRPTLVPRFVPEFRFSLLCTQLEVLEAFHSGDFSRRRGHRACQRVATRSIFRWLFSRNYGACLGACAWCELLIPQQIAWLKRRRNRWGCWSIISILDNIKYKHPDYFTAFTSVPVGLPMSYGTIGSDCYTSCQWHEATSPPYLAPYANMQSVRVVRPTCSRLSMLQFVHR